jgi:hypothetical protein
MGTEAYTNVWQMIIMTRNTACTLYDNSRICVTRMGTEVYTNVWQMIIMTRNTAVQTIWQLQNMCSKNGYTGIYKCMTDDNNDTKYSVQTIWQLQNICNRNGYRSICKCMTDDNNDTKYSRTNYMTTPEYV